MSDFLLFLFFITLNFNINDVSCNLVSVYNFDVFKEVAQRETKKKMGEDAVDHLFDSSPDLSFNGHLDSSLSVSLLER